MSETDVGLSELPDGWMWLTVGSAITKVHLTGKKLESIHTRIDKAIF